MRAPRNIYVSVSNDLVTDQRVNKVCFSLHQAGYSVKLIGRRKKNSPALQKRKYSTKRFKLLFEKGPFFYLNYNLRLLIYLMIKRPNILLSNDLDTLPANFLASRILSRPLVYDSHEYFTEVPELVNRGKVRKVWEILESWMLPKLKHSYTVSQAIADAYQKKYGLKMKLVRNFPLRQPTGSAGRNEDELKIILYQGAINIHRGIEQLVEAMQWVDGAKFLIVGGGDIENELRYKIVKHQVENKVEYLGRKAFEELSQITSKASLGVSLEQQVGLNYTYALPNKIFDYIHANVPVLASDLPEIKRIFEKYEVGELSTSSEPRYLANKINSMLQSPKMPFWKAQCQLAAQEYNWQNEEKTLLSIFEKL